MIKLDDNYFIISNEYNWILRYEKEIEKIIEGEPEIVLSSKSWYYPSISSVLKAYVDKSLKEVDGIPEILTRLEELHSMILHRKF